MQAPELSEVSKSVAQRFSDALTPALAGACDASWRVRLAAEPSGTPPAGEAAAVFRCSFEGPCSGEVIFVSSHATLEKLLLRDIPEDDWDKQKARAIKLLSLLDGCMAGIAASLDEKGTISARVESLTQFELKDERVVELLLEREGDSGSGDPMALYLCLSQRFLTAVQALSAKPFVFGAAAQSKDSNLDIVMDVELNVTLRFGQRQLALREVLELNSGSVVELDRQVDEPVELVLDGRVVARGEAVIIDGNYGMRITQLIPNMLP